MTCMTFKRIKSPRLDRPGARAVYELSEEVAYDKGKTTRHVMADFAYTFDHGPETMVFPADEEGNVLDWRELWVDYRDAVSDDSAVSDFCMAMGLPDEIREAVGL